MTKTCAAFYRKAASSGLCLILLCSPMKAATDPLQTVHSRTITLLLGGGGGGEQQRRLIQSNHDWCEEQLKQPFQPVAWEDKSGQDIGNRLAERAAILSRLAIVYRSDKSGLNKSPELRRRIEQTLANILEHFNPKTPRPGNWYHWQIPLPNHLGATALLMDTDLSPALSARVVEAMRFQLRDMNLEGVNAAWEARNNMYLALLEKDKERMQRASNHVFKSVRYGRNGGVREDYGYTFHGVIPYAGAYGAGFVQTVSQFIYLFEGTPWAAKAWQTELMAHTLLEHFRWFLFAGRTDMHVMGRNYAWGKSAFGFSSVAEAFLLLSQVETARRGELAATAIALLAMKPDAASSLGGFADRLPKIPGNLPLGFRYWPSGEMGAFNTGTFHVGFRQYSSRVQDYEFLTMRGAEGWNLPYGFTFIMRSDGTGSWFDKNAVETEARSNMLREIDMQHLPGTTARQDGNPVNQVKDFDYTGYGLNFGTSPFAGGAGGKEGGAAGFILVPPYSGFRARKSLHFFREGFWALGSGIESGDRIWKEGQAVHTTVLQWPCSAAETSLFVDGVDYPLGKDTRVKTVRWLWVERLAVVFAEPTKISIRRRGSVLTAWIDHGVRPKGGAYAFATLPDTTLEDAARFAKSLPVRPLRRDPAVHAVVDEARGHASYVFFEPGACQDVESKQPLVLYLDSGKDGGLLSLQDPLHRQAPLHLSAKISGKINKAAPEFEFGKESEGRTNLSVATFPGRIYQAGHGPAGKDIPSTPRVDLSALHQFRVEADSDATRTLLTVHVPPKLKDGEYELSIHGDRGHLVAPLTEKDILDHPAPGVTRYTWLRKQEGTAFSGRRKPQTEGDFRVFLRTGTSESVEYFTVPIFKADGSVDASAGFRRDLDNPARPKIPWNSRYTKAD